MQVQNGCAPFKAIKTFLRHLRCHNGLHLSDEQRNQSRFRRPRLIHETCIPGQIQRTNADNCGDWKQSSFDCFWFPRLIPGLACLASRLHPFSLKIEIKASRKQQVWKEITAAVSSVGVDNQISGSCFNISITHLWYMWSFIASALLLSVTVTITLLLQYLLRRHSLCAWGRV